LIHHHSTSPLAQPAGFFLLPPQHRIPASLAVLDRHALDLLLELERPEVFLWVCAGLIAAHQISAMVGLG